MKLSPFERALVACALLVLVAAALVRPIARLVSPRIAVADQLGCEPGETFSKFLDWQTHEVHDRHGTSIPLDPWGDPWIVWKEDRYVMVYSAGPNGLDDHGEGDDVVLYTWGWRGPGPAFENVFYARPALFVLAAFLVALLVARRWARAPRSAAVQLELLRAARLLVPFLLVLLLFFALFAEEVLKATYGLSRAKPLPLSSVPWPVAACGTGVVIAYVIALGVRAKAAPEEDRSLM